jgi:hypothetical protein
VYFLFGEPEDSAKPHVYIGEAENCSTRLDDHNRKKDFWTTAVVVTTKSNSLDKAQVKYLEWFMIKEAKDAGRYNVTNGQQPSPPNISDSRVADLVDYVSTAKMLLSTLGFPVLEKISQAATTNTEVVSTRSSQHEKESILLCSRGDISARGQYTDDGLLVLEGSQAKMREYDSCPVSASDQRKRLKNDGTLTEEDNVLCFTENYLFGSPSAAASVVLAQSANGWKEWKTESGRTLKDIYRS